MDGVIENYSKFEVCSVVRVLQAKGVSQSKIHMQVSESVWCNKFKDGRMTLNDDHRNTEADQGPRTMMKIVSLSKV
jgi:hypothetical protein